MCLTMFVFHSRVTLYAEFLPTKQRAKCVVLLDVSFCYFTFYGSFGFYSDFTIFILSPVLLGTRCLRRSSTCSIHNANFGLEVAPCHFYYTATGIRHILSGEFYKHYLRN